MRRAKKIEVLLEFLIFGIIIGIAEDLIAVTLTTGEPITLRIVGIIILIAIPFAFVGEILADNIDMTKYIEKYLLRRDNKKKIQHQRII